MHSTPSTPNIPMADRRRVSFPSEHHGSHLVRRASEKRDPFTLVCGSDARGPVIHKSKASSCKILSCGLTLEGFAHDWTLRVHLNSCSHPILHLISGDSTAQNDIKRPSKISAAASLGSPKTLVRDED